jgi:hypothetical protein
LAASSFHHLFQFSFRFGSALCLPKEKLRAARLLSLWSPFWRKLVKPAQLRERSVRAAPGTGEFRDQALQRRIASRWRSILRKSMARTLLQAGQYTSSQ